MHAGALRIGALSARTGLSIDTIRFYERERLLRSPRRSSGGFRLFAEADVAVLHFIKSAQELGFSLDEIRDLLALRQDTDKACPSMQRLLEGKLSAVENKIRTLKVMESELKTSLRKCASTLENLSGSRTPNCPVLEEISGTVRQAEEQ
jgi:DNA-binding transcriptional MerR regulator